MNRKVVMWSGTALVILALAGFVLPDWVSFLVKTAMAKGLVALSVVLLMRAGLVSFGQGLFYAAGAYVVALLIRDQGITEIMVLIPIAVGFNMILAAGVGLLVARYREIFFGMLTLAFSMAFYGILVRAYDITRGTDGVGVAGVTLLGQSAPSGSTIIYLFIVACLGVVGVLVYLYANSPLGYLTRSIRDNEVRVAYLGGSVRWAIYITFILTCGLAGLGGALSSIVIGHVDPDFAYWTTSGEFVFIALLGGSGNITAPFAGALVFEFVRSEAASAFPDSWQMILGAVMLVIILFLPGGLYELYERINKRLRQRGTDARELQPTTGSEQATV